MLRFGQPVYRLKKGSSKSKVGVIVAIDEINNNYQVKWNGTITTWVRDCKIEGLITYKSKL